MARLNVNPTRMELQKLKQRLKTANRGHKLLKDKSDEMIRQFLVYIKQNKALRESLENKINDALKSFTVSRSKMTNQEISQALAMPSVAFTITSDLASIMGLSVPSLTVSNFKQTDILPYSLSTSNSQLDKSIITLSSLLTQIIKLAETEKICDMLASEIEKNKRRINALEFILIPQIQETIKYITMKLAENERNNLIRLMKVKESLNDTNS